MKDKVGASRLMSALGTAQHAFGEFDLFGRSRAVVFVLILTLGVHSAHSVSPERILLHSAGEPSPGLQLTAKTRLPADPRMRSRSEKATSDSVRAVNTLQDITYIRCRLMQIRIHKVAVPYHRRYGHDNEMAK